MKLQRRIAYLLLVVSMIMLGVPVAPHHHHTDGLLCMKNDISDTCCEKPVEKSGQEQEHCCCHTGCITTHFFQQRSDTDTGWMHPTPHGTPCFLPACLSTLSVDLPAPNRWKKKRIPYYIESLHSTLIMRAAGLRAPPSTLF